MVSAIISDTSDDGKLNDNWLILRSISYWYTLALKIFYQVNNWKLYDRVYSNFPTSAINAITTLEDVKPERVVMITRGNCYPLWDEFKVNLSFIISKHAKYNKGGKM